MDRETGNQGLRELHALLEGLHPIQDGGSGKEPEGLRTVEHFLEEQAQLQAEHEDREAREAVAAGIY